MCVYNYKSVHTTKIVTENSTNKQNKQERETERDGQRRNTNKTKQRANKQNSAAIALPHLYRSSADDVQFYCFFCFCFSSLE